MTGFSRFQKCALAGFGALSGLAFVYHNVLGFQETSQQSQQESPLIYKSWTTNFTPSVSWDSNWDK